MADLARLKAQLLTSGLSQQNNALFQVINQLIDDALSVRKIAENAGEGNVVGPSLSTDNAIVRFDGTTGKIIQNSGITIADGVAGTLSGSNSGDVTLAGTSDYLTILNQVITRGLIDLATDITGLLPIANILGYYAPLSDGDEFETNFIYADGEVVMVFVYS